MECNNSICLCTHKDGCEYGWIWGIEKDRIVHTNPDGEKKVEVIEHEVVRPCPNCQPQKAAIFASASNRYELQEALRNQSHFTREKNFKESEESKTRTL